VELREKRNNVLARQLEITEVEQALKSSVRCQSYKTFFFVIYEFFQKVRVLVLPSFSRLGLELTLLEWST
jgi:hypothetical protein